MPPISVVDGAGLGKELAGLLAVPVIVPSHLNRELTRRSDPRPQLADL